MGTLIIPCAGRTFINGIPKYLIKHPTGSYLIEKCMQGIKPEKFEKIIITVLKDDVERFDAENKIKSIFSDKYPVQVLVLENETSGPAETIYKTIKLANVTGSVVVKDCDNFVLVDELFDYNFVAGLDLNEWEKDVHNLRNKSFLILNEQKQVLDIIEKQFRSDVICLGLYGFKNAQDLVSAYEHLNDPSYPISKLYLSHIISYLIGCSQKVFRYISATEYENWGSEHLWNDIQKSYATYFVDMDALVKGGKLSSATVRKLKKLQNAGATLVAFTAGDTAFAEAYKLNLLQCGIQGVNVVSGCSHSSVKRIISSEEKLNNYALEL